MIFKISDFSLSRQIEIERLFSVYSSSISDEIPNERKVNFASLYVTSTCHLKCIHCHAEDSFTGLEFKDALPEQIIRIINKIALFTNRIQLTGGEIMIRKDPITGLNDIPFLVSEIFRRRRETIFQTTGMHLTPKLVDWISLHGVKWISLSLDGSDIGTNNFIRKNDKAFTKIMQILPMIKKKNLLVKIGTVITKLNCDMNKLIELGELMIKLKVDNWKLTQFFPRTLGRASYKYKDFLSIENDLFDEITQTIKIRFGNDLRISTHSLNDFHNSPALLVQPNGLVSVTIGNDDIFLGDILNDNFKGFLNNLESVKNKISENGIKTY